MDREHPSPSMDSLHRSWRHFCCLKEASAIHGRSPPSVNEGIKDIHMLPSIRRLDVLRDIIKKTQESDDGTIIGYSVVIFNFPTKKEDIILSLDRLHNYKVYYIFVI